MTAGFGQTCLIFFMTLVFSLPLGLLMYFGRVSKIKLVSGIVKFYISVMRGTPLMLQLLVWYYAPYYLWGMNIGGYKLTAILDVYKRQFQNMVASGQLADIIACESTSDLEKLGKDGGMLPLNDLIDEHAPNIKKMLEEDPNFKYQATAEDGNIYNIPLGKELQSSQFYWIRQDWLDKLGLAVPTTCLLYTSGILYDRRK